MVDFVEYPVVRETVIHVVPGQIQRYEENRDLQGFLVLFQPEACGVEAPSLRWPTCFRSSKQDFEVLESVVWTMFGLKGQELQTSPDRLAWRLLAAVLELCDGAAQDQLTRDSPVRSLEFEAFDGLLEREFSRHRDLAWYAAELGYSAKTLSRWSRRVVGTNAKAHIDRRVALEAKRLLVHTERSTESIAARLGFSEATNFVKFFRRMAGTTPSDFRRSFSGVGDPRAAGVSTPENRAGRAES